MANKKNASLGLLLSLLCLILCACAGHKPETSAEELGRVGMAVTTAGPDGATYRLTPGATLELLSTTGEPNYDVGLDGDSSVVTVAVLPGTYNGSLIDNAGDTTQWPLERTFGGSTSTVTGVLTTPQPVPVTVVSQQTTSLVLQFSVATAGTITFDRGNLGVSINVSQQQAGGFTAGADGTGDVAGTPTATGPFGPGLRTLLPAAGSTGLHVAVSGHLTGPWQDVGGVIDPDGTSLSVCAPLQLDSSSASGHDGLIALVSEANHGTSPNFLQGSANLCVIDTGTSSQVRIRFSREGTPDTAAFQSVLGATPSIFHVQVIGDLPTRAYNSQTGVFDANALVGASALPMTLRLQVRDDADLTTIWYSARITGTETFTFATMP